MALRIIPKPGQQKVTLAPATPTKKVIGNSHKPLMPDPAENKNKAISIRLSDTHIGYLKECMGVRDCDRSEALRQAIRHERLALTNYNAKLIVSDRSGKVKEIPIVIDGVPT